MEKNISCFVKIKFIKGIIEIKLKYKLKNKKIIYIWIFL